MTDEEKAEGITAKQFDIDTERVRFFCSLYKNDYHEVHTFFNGYLDGIKAGRKEGEKEIVVLKEQNRNILEVNNALNEWVDELEEQIELIRRFFNVNEMKEFAAYVLYYTANPGSTMCIPNCIFEKVDEMYNAWFKRCDTCNYSKTCGMRSVFEEVKSKDRNAVCGEWRLAE